jgi:hypothetical protein
MTMPKNRVFAIKFAKVYPLYVQKAEHKNRTKEEVDRIICWLTGFDEAGLQQQIEQENDLETFFAQSPGIHPNSALIKGVVMRCARRRNRRSTDTKNSLLRQTHR